MDKTSKPIISSMAENYILCMADFPKNLLPDHLDCPPAEQEMILSGLRELREVIHAIYRHMAELPADLVQAQKLTDEQSCWKAIERPIKLLWAIGYTGSLHRAPDSTVMQTSRAELEQALKARGERDAGEGFTQLESVGFTVYFLQADGETRTTRYKTCSSISIAYPPANEALLLALAYCTSRLPVLRKSLPFQLFLSADFRPLMLGYTVIDPHLPANEDEVTRTLDPKQLYMWRALTDYAAEKYPNHHLFFRPPGLRNRQWVTDISTTGKDYGAWSIMTSEDGLRIRFAMKKSGYQYTLDVHHAHPR